MKISTTIHRVISALAAATTRSTEPAANHTVTFEPAILSVSLWIPTEMLQPSPPSAFSFGFPWTHNESTVEPSHVNVTELVNRYVQQHGAWSANNLPITANLTMADGAMSAIHPECTDCKNCVVMCLAWVWLPMVFWPCFGGCAASAECKNGC